MRIEVLVSRVSDNRIYWIEEDQDVLVVDPIDAEQVIEQARARRPKRLRILTTHGHGDHQGGNRDVVEALGCAVLAPAHEPDFPVPCDEPLHAGDRVELGSTSFEVLSVPGHTRGHIALWTPGWLISGDVLFFAGVGTCRFGGDPEVLFDTLHSRLRRLPDTTRYLPGHEYGARNVAFQKAVGTPTDELHQAGETIAQLGDGLPAGAAADAPVPHTLGWERRNSLFFRVEEAAVQQAVRRWVPDVLGGASSSVDRARATFVALRGLRDTFPAWCHS